MKKSALLPCILLAVSVHAQNWFQIPTGTGKQLNTIDFPSSTVGYIGGNDSLLLKTIDGGQTWQEVNYSGITFYPNGEHIVKLQFITETIGFAAIGPYTGSYKTSDGGLTWQALPLSSNLCFNKGMYFFDENNGVIGGSGCFQGELVDQLVSGTWSAATINAVTLDANNSITDIDFYGANLGLASSAGGRFLRTTNGGQNWDTITSPYGVEVPLLSVLMIDDTLAFAGYDQIDGAGFGLLTSHDAGLTWSEEFGMATFAYPDYFGIHRAGNGKIYAGAKSYLMSTGMIYSATNNHDWNYEGVDHPIYDFSSYNDSIVFGIGDSGYLVTNVPLAILNFGEQSALDFNMDVFPNPTTGKLSITLPAGHSTEFNYQLVTTAGKLINTGRLEGMQVDLAPLAAGIYLLHVTDGEKTYMSRIIKE